MTLSATAQSKTGIREFDLNNGLHVILQEDRFAPVVAFQMWVKVGSAEETTDEAGLAHVLEHMLFKGTKKRGVGEIARDVEGAGGDINAWTSHDETVYHLVLPSAEFDEGLDIIADAIQHSALDPEELARELEVIREEIKRGKDSPSRRLSEELFDLSFTKHPYRLPVIGTDDSVRSFTHEKVMAFYRKWYVPENMTLVVVGDFDTDVARPKLDDIFDDFTNNAPVAHLAIEEPNQTTPRARVVVDDSKQARLAVTFNGPSLASEEICALDVLSVILGQGDSSRLMQQLQREKTWVNDVSAYIYAGRTAGLFMVEADLPVERVADVTEHLGRELLRLTKENVTETELGKAKTILENEAIFHMQTVQGKARRLGYGKTLAGDTLFNEKYLDGIRKLTAEDMKQTVVKTIREDAVNLTLLWPEEVKNAPTEKTLIDQFLKGAGQASQTANYSLDDNGILRMTLANGVRLLVKSNPSTPVVSFQAAMLAGLRFETEENNGINNLLSNMLTLGTRRMNAKEFAEAIDGMGAMLNGFSGRNTLGLKASVIKRQFEKGFRLFAECLNEPAFAPDELEKEKLLALEEIRNRDENPARVAFDLFHRTIYTTHPFRMDMLGTEDSIKGFSPDTLHDYYNSIFKPENLVITIVGDISIDEAVSATEAAFGHIPKGKLELDPPELEPPMKSSRESFKDMDKAQSHVVLGFPGLRFTDDDRFTLEVINAVLAGQGGRLFMELRDKLSLAYSVSAYHLESLEPGYFLTYIGTSPDKIEQAREGMLNELQKLLDGKLSEEEVEHAKRYLSGSHAIGMQTNSSVAGKMLLDELYDIGYDAFVNYADCIQAIEVKDVLRVAKKILTLDRYVYTVVGPADYVD